MMSDLPVSEEDEKTATDERNDHSHVACRPRFLKPLARPSVFSVLTALILVVQFAAINGYTGAIVSTLEKQFLLSSTEVGAISIVNDVASLLAVGILTYVGHTSHRPRLIGFGAMLVGVGTAACALPHFVTDPSVNADRITATSRELCWDFDNSTRPGGTNQSTNQSYLGSLSLFIIGQILVGIGSAPILPLAMTYVDDAVQEHKTVVYVAVIYIGTSLGPIVGFLVSSWTLGLPVNLNTSDTMSNLNRYDPRWIGAWWLGLLIFGAALVVLSLPLLLFPRHLVPQSNSYQNDGGVDACESKCNMNDEMKVRQNDDQTAQSKSGGFETITKQVKGFLLALMRLGRNVTLVALGLALSTELAIVGGFTTFGAKFIETQFSIPAGRAAFITGVTVLPAACAGHLIAGAIVRKLRLSAFQCSVFLVVMVSVTLAVYPFLIIIGCETPSIISSTSDMDCNNQCVCDKTTVDPVCGNDGSTYLSPCLAGCTGYGDVKNQTFTDCVCVEDHETETTPGGGADSGGWDAKASTCHAECTTKIAYIAVLSMSLFAMFSGQNPSMIINLRSVEEKDRSFAIGMLTFFAKVLGFFPAPPIFGAIIKTTCLLYRSSDGAVEYEDTGKSVCWHYDLLLLRKRFVGLLIALKSCTLLFCVIIAVSLWRRKKEEKKIQLLRSASSETTAM